ncbi:alpha-ketoglutarate-dependent dioxygenase AlkB [Ferruginibacter sp.]|uniref:alpha-ketoglutarate-dependent dioxygenase AlkB n=1 Tax=Ferruginibacter sp. TaxID=1940288 RepID=UPI00349E60AE
MSGDYFNSCQLSLYHTGDKGMPCYSVDKKASGISTTMASVSFGTVRKFSLKYKNSRQTIYVHLQSSGILVIKNATQTNWPHILP